MRTIAFYSYKGGNGKSLAAANLAVCLSRLGKNCALVDFDLDAPSLHHKIGVGDTALGIGGIVRVVEESIVLPKDKNWNEARLQDVEFRTPRDVKQFSLLLDDLREREAADKRREYGKIRFFAAGNMNGARYWEIVWSSLWRDIFTVLHRYDHRAASIEELDKALDFLRQIKQRIASLDERPEYLILDCRSGASDLTTTIISAWLDNAETDRLVYVLSFNEDSINYLDKMIKDMTTDMRKRMMLALCRVPLSIEYRGDRKLMSAMHKLGVDWTELDVLHSDRDLEGEERLRLGLHAPPENRRLTKEYLQIFEKLIPPEHRQGKKLKEAIGVGELIEERDRMFNLDSKTGALINPNDGTRNVSFKVETFQLLLQGLEKGLENPKEGTLTAARPQNNPDQTQASLAHLLFHAGTQCGQRFGDSLASQLSESFEMSTQEKIQKWCHFDSDVGFGKFELDIFSIETRGPLLLRCDVILQESFLTPSSDTQFRSGPHKYCELMRGYVQGVLERLLNLAEDALEVNHESLPRTDGGRSESCRFAICDKAQKKREATSIGNR